MDGLVPEEGLEAVGAVGAVAVLVNFLVAGGVDPDELSAAAAAGEVLIVAILAERVFGGPGIVLQPDPCPALPTVGGALLQAGGAQGTVSQDLLLCDGVCISAEGADKGLVHNLISPSVT